MKLSNGWEFWKRKAWGMRIISQGFQGHLLTSCSSSCLHGCTSVLKWKHPFSIRSPPLERGQHYPYPVGLPFTPPSRCFRHLESETWVGDIAAETTQAAMPQKLMEQTQQRQEAQGCTQDQLNPGSRDENVWRTQWAGNTGWVGLPLLEIQLCTEQSHTE